MKRILVLDSKNYDPSLPEICRTAVRGIIFMDGKLLLTCSKFGALKFPGGGQEVGETDFDTLIRETLEETGYHVIADSIREFGEVEEKRLSIYEPMIWHQINRYYFCAVKKEREECHYTESEEKYGFHQVWHSLDEAIQISQNLLRKEGPLPWNQREFQRELQILKLLQKAIQDQSVII